MAKAPVLAFPEILVERVFVTTVLVEAVGIEPTSEEQSQSGATERFLCLVFEDGAPAGRLPER